ncbi:sensor histidine kinase [Nakamurella flava]|uniref:sensor histidine kinase n=1 Tax=Nakamurella flava TaxID=2576308 RepID=UPI001F102B57|nr:HAMP domain-containing sensor histidine kinase [Nakamurella flava]
MLALIVVVCAVLGVTTEIFLSRYLVAQVDQQLKVWDDKPGNPYDHAGTSWGGGRCASGQLPGRGPGLQRGSVWLTAEGSEIYDSGAVPYGENPTCVELTSTAQTELLAVPTDGVIRTVSIDGLGDYRVRADVDDFGVTRLAGQSLDPVHASLVRLGVIMAAVTGVALLIGAGVVVLIVRRALRPLDRVAATAHQVSSMPLASGDVDLAVRVPEQDTDPRTEVGQVGAALNQMLGHVSGALVARQESETRVRQFVADASHELRTPLASIRGYAELARREGQRTPGRDGDDEDVTAHALRRVESESARMTTLVEDLLLLARLDSGRPLSRDEVDLTMLVLDAVSDARVAGRDHHWQLDLPEEPVTAVGDAHRLHQVVANLLANARAHTPAGTRVETGLRVDGAWAILTVTDSGPGIPADLQPEIFNRFVRGDSSRSRAAGSTGLGLAIVDAVTSAHGGSVQVRSRPGRTTFVVRLPRPADEGAASTAAPIVDAGPATVRR